jgi:hypothetical protein
MKNRPILAALLIALPAAGARATDVASFLVRADYLTKKGIAALFSSEPRTMQAEVVSDMKAIASENRAARSGGGRPFICAPGNKVTLASDEMLAAFRAIPAARRPHTDVKEALRALLSRKYPCAQAR